VEHAEVVELIEVAAAEPGGLDRLSAGDTPEAQAVVAHIAGCEACAAEFAALGRVAASVRETVRALPDPSLRARTLDLVRELGVDRAAPRPGPTRTAPVEVLAPRAARPRRVHWAAVGIAAVVVAGVAGFAAGGAGRLPGSGQPPTVAMAANKTTMHIAEQGDVVRVSLASADGGGASGSVIFSATSGELSLTVAGLSGLPSGAEYVCWVEQGGQHRQLGVLYIEGGDGTWAGAVSGLGDLGPGTRFGVSRRSSAGETGAPVLTGGR